MPQSLHSINNRALSCDQDIMRIPHVNEDMISATGISSSSSEHDNQETNAWSSDYSNSEDEFSHFEENVIPVLKLFFNVLFSTVMTVFLIKGYQVQIIG